MIKGVLGIFSAAAVAIALSGCTASGAASPTASPSGSPTPTETTSPTPSPTSSTPETDPSEAPADCLSQEQALEVLEATEAAAANGLTERYFSQDGSQWVLVLNPAQENDYTAAWFNTATGEGELVYDGLTFSYLYGLVALSQGEQDDELMFYDVRYQCQDGGFSVSSGDSADDNDFGYRYYVSSAGLLESANVLNNEVETGDQVQFEYEVEQQWLDALDALVDELLSSF